MKGKRGDSGRVISLKGVCLDENEVGKGNIQNNFEDKKSSSN